MYSQGNREGRVNRISGYAFNPTGGLGAGSYFQDPVTPGQWIHYAFVINTTSVSATCPTGYVKIYKNGVLRDRDSLSDYSVRPSRTASPMRIGSASLRSYFLGAIAKVAIYQCELKAAQLADHHRVMTRVGGSEALLVRPSTFCASCPQLRRWKPTQAAVHVPEPGLPARVPEAGRGGRATCPSALTSGRPPPCGPISVLSPPAPVFGAGSRRRRLRFSCRTQGSPSSPRWGDRPAGRVSTTA
ncbi:LamG-like jellyroll fold domain-containing protein [Streptomyces sp. NPDC056910]|uniref:LamG-like jellyroll fold domain-containing protein n=1 Tax=Streptomyces sp. NPDC056910 TaxID=3345964 RepID=UPI00368EF7D7